MRPARSEWEKQQQWRHQQQELISDKAHYEARISLKIQPLLGRAAGHFWQQMRLKNPFVGRNISQQDKQVEGEETVLSYKILTNVETDIHKAVKWTERAVGPPAR